MKCIVGILLSLIPFLGIAQQNEVEEITKTINLYFEGMVQRDRKMLDEAFLPEARLIGYRGKEFTITPFETWAGNTATGTPRDPAQHQNSIKNIRVNSYTAMVEAELFWPGIYYFDFLTLIKVDNKWKIVHKSWYEEKR